MPTTKKLTSAQALWESVSSMFVHFVEKVFYLLGVFLARNPWKTIVVTWIFVLISCSGLLRFYIEKNPIKLWVPPESDFYYDTNWYIDKFGTIFRLQRMLITSDNILDREVLMEIHGITKNVNLLSINHNNNTYSLSDLCFKVPIINFGYSNEKQSKSTAKLKPKPFDGNLSEIDYTDATLWMDDEFYCSLIENFPSTCLESNLLDIWNNDLDLIKNATKHDIITKVNQMKTNPVTGHPLDFSKLLGGIQHDEGGNIVTAQTVLITWYTKVNMSEVDLGEVGNLVGTEDWVSITLSKWEEEFLNYAASLKNKHGIKVYYEAGRSFADTSGEAMFQEMGKLFLGIACMFIYVLATISRCNWLEIRLTLAAVGMLSVGMAYFTSIAWCSALGISFGPVHSSLPFLLMGLGLDDMFVMNACWKMVTASDSTQSIPIKIGHMLKHAGVSIVITSFTDIVALLVGAITILPSLKSFCLYAAMGVFFIFLYSVTFFVAVFTLDIYRIESRRNAVILCYQHSKDIKLTTEKSLFQKLLVKFYKNIVFTKPGKTLSILFTLIMTCVSIEAVLHLEQKFDPRWFIPDDTYYKEFLNTYEHYYPEEGNMAMAFFGSMDCNAEFQQLYNVVQLLKNESYVTDMSAWVEHFHKYVLKNYNHDLLNSNSTTDSDFKKYLSRFLFSPIGGRFQLSVKFVTPLQCGKIANDILASSMSFRFRRFDGPIHYIPAMHHVKDIVKSANITTGDGYRSVWSKAFGNWATDEVISIEVERNIELALLCVMLCTVVLITNLQMCLWIFICVLLTIINVLGWMQRWGMTVDIVCCIGLELAIGLCVDYAAHVGHTFLTITQGNRNERALETVRSIGSAVLLGGGSTFLSLSFLSMSKAYTFQSFFKIFLLVILFGLYNGLIFLPVILSLIGPSRGGSNEKKDTSPESVELNSKLKQIDES